MAYFRTRRSNSTTQPLTPTVLTQYWLHDFHKIVKNKTVVSIGLRFEPFETPCLQLQWLLTFHYGYGMWGGGVMLDCREETVAQ
jgi:hypothetical protein